MRIKIPAQAKLGQGRPLEFEGLILSDIVRRVAAAFGTFPTRPWDRRDG